jgi:hypothetical protein
MAFGEPRLDTIDDVSAVLSVIRERIAIVAQRQRMSLTDRDIAEFEGVYDDLDRIHDLILHLRDRLSTDYRARNGQ